MAMHRLLIVLSVSLQGLSGAVQEGFASEEGRTRVAPVETSSCGPQGGEGVCGTVEGSEGVQGPSRLSRDHQLIQMKSDSAVQLSVVQGGKEEIPGELNCLGMEDVKMLCASNGCKVLADKMQGKTCTEYCARDGRACMNAWEEMDNNCEVKEAMRCNQIWGTTSDLLCECAREQSPVLGPGGKDGHCHGMWNVKKQCSDNGCKVLADHMQGKTCQEYCGTAGKSCIGAWEEVNDNCEVSQELRCNQTWGTTSDLLCECSSGGASGGGAGSQPSEGRLVWSDDFDGDNVDDSKWGFVEGGGGFGNQELQFYTRRSSNARTEHGVLKITAKCEQYGGQSYTSAKLQTRGRMQWGPGHKVEVRAKLPQGRGTWPAIWMLPVQNTYGGWPRSGEIDIMEAVGCTANKVYGTVHTQAYNHMKHTEKTNSVPTDVATWHIYAIEWTASEIRWYLDGQLFHRFVPNDLNDSEKWPFNRDFHLILNLAVGGSWGAFCLGGWPSCSSQSEFGREQVLEVDYARVYAL